MAYIGKEPTIGNFQKCDAISVVNGQAAYTLQVGGTNVVPESVNHMLVSLNGILQAPTDSFTVSGSTLTFASNLATGDVIDFVMILGNVLDLGVPSDNTVTAAKLNNDIISGTTALTSAPDDTDEFLVSDAGTLKRIDYSLIKSTPSATLLSTATASSDTEIDFTSNIDSTYKIYRIDLINVVPGTDAASLYMRFFQGGTIDTGSVYDYLISKTQANSTSTEVAQGVNQGQMILADSVDSLTEGGVYGSVYVFDPSNSNTNTNIKHSLLNQRNGDNLNQNFGMGRIEETVAVDGFRFLFSSGNIYQGTIKLYGIS